MYLRVEVAVKPEFPDAAAVRLLRQIELAHPDIRRSIRWLRSLHVFWIEMEATREEAIQGLQEIFQDRVLSWLFTGNLIPSAAGATGSLADLMSEAPERPGVFWGLEKKYRPGVTDNAAKVTLEAFEIVLGRRFAEARVSTGQLLLIEGPKLNEDALGALSTDVFANELIESWTLYGEEELRNNGRFHHEQVKRQLFAPPVRSRPTIDSFPIRAVSDEHLESVSRERLLALNLEEMKAIREHFYRDAEIERRKAHGLLDPTDVELEVIAQTWSEHCKHKIFNARIDYKATGKGIEREPIPSEIKSLFKSTIVDVTAKNKKPWLLSVFDDNAGIVAFDEDDAVCIKVETHNSPSALDPYGGALTGIVGVNRDILGCGRGAKPIFNTDVFCVAPPDYGKKLPDRILHPRRILQGITRGVEDGGNKSGIPTINGALCFDDRYLGKPLVYCGTGGIMPRKTPDGVRCEEKTIKPGDLICMAGGRVGKDGIHGATFSSMAFTESSPSSAVQLGDPLTQKRMADFLLEARDLGLYRTLTDNGAGGLSSSVGELARLSGGAKMDVAQAKTKVPGLRPYELVVSESQERMTLAVPPEKRKSFEELAALRGVELSFLGEFTSSGYFEIAYQGKIVCSLSLEFLHRGNPELFIEAKWDGMARVPHASSAAFEKEGVARLKELLGRPNIASKEWLIRQYDHEVQGASVIKPLHTTAIGSRASISGPNDAGVIKPKPQSMAGLAVACGLAPRLSDVDAFVMAQAAVDEAVRNILCVGGEYGKTESLLALVDNFCWPDPVSNPKFAGDLVRACYGMREACLELGLPLVSGKDSMKNDYRGKLGGETVKISVVPTLLMTAIARVADIRHCKTADFKSPGDVIYLIGGGGDLGLHGSELQSLLAETQTALPVQPGFAAEAKLSLPDWEVARKTYRWLGGGAGKRQAMLRSIHDVSDGGVSVAVAEGLIARGYGAELRLPEGCEPWAFWMGEGFHAFVASCSPENAEILEAEWGEQGVPFKKIGFVNGTDKLAFKWTSALQGAAECAVGVAELRAAWKKEGYWE